MGTGFLYLQVFGPSPHPGPGVLNLSVSPLPEEARAVPHADTVSRLREFHGISTIDGWDHANICFPCVCPGSKANLLMWVAYRASASLRGLLTSTDRLQKSTATCDVGHKL